MKPTAFGTNPSPKGASVNIRRDVRETKKKEKGAMYYLRQLNSSREYRLRAPKKEVTKQTTKKKDKIGHINPRDKRRPLGKECSVAPGRRSHDIQYPQQLTWEGRRVETTEYKKEKDKE